MLAFFCSAACKPKAPTYHRDIAPILRATCHECHHQGGIMPAPRFDDYEHARMYAQAIRIATQARRMPPWGVDNTGLCNQWQGARWLSTEAIATLAAWEAAGAPEGEKSAAAPTENAPVPFRSDVKLTTGGAYRPGIGDGGYRCFVVDPQQANDTTLTALRIGGRDPRAVAHVTLFALDTPAAEQAAIALDAATPGLGYTCFGTARVADARLLASWSWPTPVQRMPPGLGVVLGAGKKLVAQIHYEIAMTTEKWSDETTIELELDANARRVSVVPITATGVLPPNRPYAAVSAQQTMAHAFDIVAIAPRMHTRGQTMQLLRDRAGASACVGNFDHWSFYSQQLFLLTQPVGIAAGDTLRVECSYRTYGRAEPLTFGDRVDQEECVAYVFALER